MDAATILSVVTACGYDFDLAASHLARRGHTTDASALRAWCATVTAAVQPEAGEGLNLDDFLTDDEGVSEGEEAYEVGLVGAVETRALVHSHRVKPTAEEVVGPEVAPAARVATIPAVTRPAVAAPVPGATSSSNLRAGQRAAVFDRVLQSLGGALPPNTAATIPAPASAGGCLPAPRHPAHHVGEVDILDDGMVSADTVTAADGSGEAMSEADSAAMVEALNAEFFARVAEGTGRAATMLTVLPAEAGWMGAAPAPRALGEGVSGVREAEIAVTGALWDKLLADVRLPVADVSECGDGGGEAALLSSSSAVGEDCHFTSDSDMGDVLRFLASTASSSCKGSARPSRDGYVGDAEGEGVKEGAGESELSHQPPPHHPVRYLYDFVYTPPLTRDDGDAWLKGKHGDKASMAGVTLAQPSAPPVPPTSHVADRGRSVVHHAHTATSMLTVPAAVEAKQDAWHTPPSTQPGSGGGGKVTVGGGRWSGLGASLGSVSRHTGRSKPGFHTSASPGGSEHDHVAAPEVVGDAIMDRAALKRRAQVRAEGTGPPAPPSSPTAVLAATVHGGTRLVPTATDDDDELMAFISAHRDGTGHGAGVEVPLIASTGGSGQQPVQGKSIASPHHAAAWPLDDDGEAEEATVARVDIPLPPSPPPKVWSEAELAALDYTVAPGGRSRAMWVTSALLGGDSDDDVKAEGRAGSGMAVPCTAGTPAATAARPLPAGTPPAAVATEEDGAEAEEEEEVGVGFTTLVRRGARRPPPTQPVANVMAELKPAAKEPASSLSLRQEAAGIPLVAGSGMVGSGGHGWQVRVADARAAPALPEARAPGHTTPWSSGCGAMTEEEAEFVIVGGGCGAGDAGVGALQPWRIHQHTATTSAVVSTALYEAGGGFGGHYSAAATASSGAGRARASWA